MRCAGFHFFLGLLSVCASSLSAAEVVGKIILQKKLGQAPLAPAVYNVRAGGAGNVSPESQNTNKFDRVAVWLESDRPEHLAPVVATIEQRNRRFEPQLVIVPTGSTVEFPNLDLVFHNIFSLSATRQFDLGYYPKGQSRRVVFPRAGVAQIYCHVHSNMYAAVVVTSSRWVSKPASDGTFQWPEVPAGKYRLMAWQRFSGLYRRDVTVDANPLNITMMIPESMKEMQRKAADVE